MFLYGYMHNPHYHDKPYSYYIYMTQIQSRININECFPSTFYVTSFYYIKIDKQ